MATSELPDGLELTEKSYKDFRGDADQVELRRPQHGKNLRLRVNGEDHDVGRIASAFPLSSSLESVAFFDTEGEEIGVMKNADSLDSTSRRILQEELDKSYFMPRILEIREMEESLGVEEWTVVTDKGERSFQVRDPRRKVRKLSETRVVIKDVDGNRYEIEDWTRMDRNSIRLLMRHL